MKLFVDKTGTVDGFIALLKRASSTKDVNSLLIFACDQNQFPAEMEKINEALAAVPQSVLGGIFPEIIYQRERLSTGSLIVGLTDEIDVFQVPNLSDQVADYEQILDEMIDDEVDGETMFVFVDGLSARIDSLIDSLFHIFGLEFNYIGGGAGSLSFEQKPCLFSKNGLLMDAAILGLINQQSGIGVRHGFETFAGPFQVTETDGPQIKSLNWQPAFDLYRSFVEAESGQKFADNDFIDLANPYPLGVHQVGGEKLIRSPVMMTKDGGLICMGEVAPNSYVSLMRGTNQSLIESANQALEYGLTRFGSQASAQATMMIECVGRLVFLEKEFQKEIDEVFNNSDQPVFGALTLGEIANQGDTYLAYHNITAVVGILA